MTLKDLPIGKTATVTVVGGEGALRQHFLDMGIIPMADVTMVKYAPMGDPVEVRIHSYEPVSYTHLVNFMTLKMIVEFEDGQEPKAVMQEVLKNCKKVEDDCEIFL